MRRQAVLIYNSRNLKLLMENMITIDGTLIYNSRNLKLLMENTIGQLHCESTIVEI